MLQIAMHNLVERRPPPFQPDVAKTALAHHFRGPRDLIVHGVDRDQPFSHRRGRKLCRQPAIFIDTPNELVEIIHGDQG